MELKVEMKATSDLKEEDIFSNKYLITNKKLLTSVALWPYQNSRLKKAMAILFVMCIFSVMIPQVIRGFEEWYAEVVNMGIIVECISGVVLYVAIGARLTMLTVQEPKMRCIYEGITRDWEEMHDLGERAILQRFCNLGRLLTIVYTVIANKYLNTTYKKALCIYTEYFVDEDEYFYYLFGHTIVCVIPLTMLFTTFDSTFMLIVQHGVGLLKILKYIESIDNTYDLYHFFLYSCLLSGFSIFTIDVVINIHNYFALIRLVPVWVAIIVYMFYLNWPGQLIIDTDEEVFAAMYA